MGGRKLERAVHRAAACALLAAGAPLIAQRVPTDEVCAPLSENQKVAIRDFLITKFKIQMDAGATLTEAEILGGCNRKMFFRAGSPEAPFSTAVFVAPDGVHVSREVWDVRLDPLEEERRERAEVSRALQDGDPMTQGARDVPVVVVVFSDFQCPFCAGSAGLLRKVIATSDGQYVRLVFRNFPLRQHAWARPAAQLAACVGNQKPEAFWLVHDSIFAHQREITPLNVEQQILSYLSVEADIDVARVRDCFARGDMSARVEHDLELGEAYGVKGTPTVFVNGEKLSAIGDESGFRAVIERALRASGGRRENLP